MPGHGPKTALFSASKNDGRDSESNGREPEWDLDATQLDEHLRTFLLGRLAAAEDVLRKEAVPEHETDEDRAHERAQGDTALQLSLIHI